MNLMTPQSKWRTGRRLVGGCIECPQPAIPGQQRCARCQDQHNATMIDLREYRATNNLCRECGEPAVPGEIRCEHHKQKNQEYMARYMAKKTAAKAIRFGKKH